MYKEEVYNEGARDNGIWRKIREIAEHKIKPVRVPTVSPVDFSRQKKR